MENVSAACDKCAVATRDDKDPLIVAIGAAIKLARKRRGLKGRHIAEAVGTTVGSVGNWENGQNRPSSDNLFKIAATLGVDAEALAKGQVLYRSNPDSLSDAEVITDMQVIPHGPSDIPQLGVVAGGSDGGFTFNGKDPSYIKRPAGLLDEPRAFALQIIGDSMVPRYEPGEIIFCDARTPEIGDYVVVETFPEQDGEMSKAFVKKLVRRTKTAIVVEQFNPAKELTFNPYAIKHLWRVVPSRELHGY